MNNDQKGIIQFEETKLTMEEDAEEYVVVKRIGGSKGRVTAVYENNPGSAVQGNYDVDGIQGEIVFENGETEKEIPIRTKRDIEVKGNLNFTVDLTNATGGAFLGFQTGMSVTIRDMDDPERLNEVRELLEECKALDYDRYVNEVEEKIEVEKLTYDLDRYLKSENMEVATALKKMWQLSAAREKLDDSCFVMPVGEKVRTVEAESFVLDASGAEAGNEVRITESANASGGEEVNWFETGNRIYLPFMASQAGAYKVTATYRSGRGPDDNPNALEWSGPTIASGSLDVRGEKGATEYHTAEFEIQVNQSGRGELIFTASEKGGPVLDKFVIECVDKTVEEEPVTGIELDPSALTLTDEENSAYLKWNISPLDATNLNVEVESSNEEVVSVEKGKYFIIVTGLKSGTADIIVKTEDGDKTAVCSVTVLRKETEKKNLDTAVSEVKDIIGAGQGDFTKESWDVFWKAYQNALAATGNETAHELQELIGKLQEARSKLVKEINKVVPLGIPANVKAVSKMTGVEISFAPVQNASSYEIYRSVKGAAPVKIATVNQSSYLDEQPVGGKTLTYTVVAVSGQSAYTNSAISAGASVTLPKTVSKFKAKAVKGGAKITFKKVKGAKNYIILRATKKNGPYKKIKTLKAKQTSYTDKKAKKGFNYYKVVAKKGKTYSPATKTKKVKVKK